jgi:hypothetical protein
LNLICVLIYYHQCFWNNHYTLYVLLAGVTESGGRKSYREGKPATSWQHIKDMRTDNNRGMLISEFTTWCIRLVGATVLHNSRVKDINNTADAAKALEPLVNSFPNAGFLAKLVFSIGLSGLVYWLCLFCPVWPLTRLQKPLTGKQA